MRKSILTSTTFWSIILLLCQAIGPHVDKVLVSNTFTPSDGWAIFQALVTALVGVIARYNIGDVHTPRGMPGIDPPRYRRDATVRTDTYIMGPHIDSNSDPPSGRALR